MSYEAAGNRARLAAAAAEPARRVAPRVAPPTGLHDTELMALIAEGMTTAAIARRAQATEQAVQSRITWLLHTTETRSRAHLVAVAIRRGWIEWAGTWWRAQPDTWAAWPDRSAD